MKKIAFIILLLFSTNAVVGQILDITQPLFTDAPFFNPNFIKQNNVKSITGSISSKKVRDIIRTKGLDYYYEFNKNGSLKIQLSSHLSSGIKDSTVVNYTYNDKGLLSVKRKNDSYGYFSYNYKYNDDNNIILQTYCRDENKLNTKKNFELKKQYIISTDSFSYKKYDDTQAKKYFYNGYKKVFKEQTNYYNKYGYLIEEYTKFIIGNNKKKFTYEYDEQGRLSKKHKYTSIAEGSKTSEFYTYDEIGNVLDIKTYDNDKHTSTKQFLYDSKTMLLTAQIIQDIETEFLRIIQYRYEFFGEETQLQFTDTLK
ncbi:MAG: hypothetical protein P1U41_10255 [Vicingaceae bacterium]|nr:hypothetical protein [Vicingaceae bacterium]